jgi:hypothetical protein
LFSVISLVVTKSKNINLWAKKRLEGLRTILLSLNSTVAGFKSKIKLYSYYTSKEKSDGGRQMGIMLSCTEFNEQNFSTVDFYKAGFFLDLKMCSPIPVQNPFARTTVSVLFLR